MNTMIDRLKEDYEDLKKLVSWFTVKGILPTALASGILNSYSGHSDEIVIYYIYHSIG